MVSDDTTGRFPLMHLSQTFGILPFWGEVVSGNSTQMALFALTFALLTAFIIFGIRLSISIVSYIKHGSFLPTVLHFLKHLSLCLYYSIFFTRVFAFLCILILFYGPALQKIQKREYKRRGEDQKPIAAMIDRV